MFGMTLSGCGPTADDRLPVTGPLDPWTDASGLTRALVVVGSHTAGAIPGATNPSLEITAHQGTASVSADNILFVPFSYAHTGPVAGVHVSARGADNHWRIPITPAGSSTVPGEPAAAGAHTSVESAMDAHGRGSGTHVVPIGLPPDLMPGAFALQYALYDEGGDVGPAVEMSVRVVAGTSSQGSQAFPTVEGNDGLTVRSFHLGASPGTFSLAWTTYVVPDRIDIRYADEWVASTGTTLDQLGVPPIVDCTQAAGQDGFIGSSGTFEFPIDPTRGDRVDVYVSGCLNGGTAWQYTPAFLATAEPPTVWHEDLPPCPCTYADAQGRGRENRPESGAPGRWIDCGAANALHHGASTEVRWVPDEARASGQQCTYDTAGRLITSGIAAGSPDRASPGACGITDGIDDWWAGSVSEHQTQDVDPFRRLPCERYLREWPSNRGVGCANNPVTAIDHMAPLVGNMTCPEIIGLIEEITRSSATTARLRRYLDGTTSMTVSQLITDLEAVAASSECRTIRDGVFICNHVRRAIRNLRGTP